MCVFGMLVRGVPRYMCDECGASFEDPRLLASHEAICKGVHKDAMRGIEEEDDEERPLREGYLTKEPMKHRGAVVGIGSKQRRYFRLYSTSITYAQNENTPKIKNKLILDTTATVELIAAGGRSFTVTSTDNQSCLRLQADDPKEAAEWVAEIEDCINKLNADINVGIDDIALTRALEGRSLEEHEVHGYLEKLPLVYQGETRTSTDIEKETWKRRYFRMRFASLEYYVSAASICPKGTLRLDASSRLDANEEKFTFTLYCQNDMISLPLKADSRRRFDKWTVRMNKRIEEIKAIKKSMVAAADDSKPEDDVMNIAKQQPILDLLLACGIEVITETLDNFKAAGVTQAGDLIKFNTPAALDEAVEDITIDDARKLLKLYYEKMKEATAKKAIIDAKQTTNNYVKQKNHLKLNAQNAGVSKQAEEVIAKNSNDRQDLSVLMGFKNVDLERSNMERQRKADAQRVHFKESVDFSITFTDIKSGASKAKKLDEYLFVVDTIAGSDAWTIRREWASFDALNARLMKKFQKQGQRDVMPDFPKFEESSDLSLMQDELSRYLVSLAASPLILTAHFFQNFVEDGRHSLVDKRPAALDVNVMMPGIPDERDLREGDEQAAESPKTAADKRKQENIERDFVNFTIPADNAYIAQGHFRVTLSKHTAPRKAKKLKDGEKEPVLLADKKDVKPKKGKDEEVSKVMYLELHVEDQWPPRRRKLSKREKAAKAVQAKLEGVEGRGRKLSIGGQGKKILGLTITEQRPGFQPGPDQTDLTDQFEGRIAVATKEIESGRVPIDVKGTYVKSKRLSKARGTDVWFMFSTKEADEARELAEAMKAAAAAEDDPSAPIEYEEDTAKEKAFKENTPRWKFSLHAYKTSISPVIAEPQHVWDLSEKTIVSCEEDREGNVLLCVRPNHMEPTKLVLKCRHDDSRTYWHKTLVRSLNFLRKAQIRRIHDEGKFNHIFKRIERWSESRDRPQLYDDRNKTVSKNCARCGGAFNDKDCPADFCRCCGDSLCFRCGIVKPIDVAFGGEPRKEHMCLVCFTLWVFKDHAHFILTGKVMQQLAELQAGEGESHGKLGPLGKLSARMGALVNTAVSPSGAAKRPQLKSPKGGASLSQMKKQLKQLKDNRQSVNAGGNVVYVPSEKDAKRIEELEEQVAQMTLSKRTAEIRLERYLQRRDFDSAARSALVKEVRRLRKLCKDQAELLIAQHIRIRSQLRVHEQELTRARLLYARNLKNLRTEQLGLLQSRLDSGAFDADGVATSLRQRGNTWAPSRSRGDFQAESWQGRNGDVEIEEAEVDQKLSQSSESADNTTKSIEVLAHAAKQVRYSGVLSSSSGLRTIVSSQLSQLERRYPQLASFLKHPRVQERELLSALIDSGVTKPTDLSHLPAAEVEMLPQYARIPPDAAMKIVEFLPVWLGDATASPRHRGRRGSAEMDRVRSGSSAPAFKLLQSAMQSPGHAPPQESFHRAWREIQIPPGVVRFSSVFFSL